MPGAVVNRRAFLKRFGIGLSAALTLAALPASAVEALTVTEAGKKCAIAFLLQRYREHLRGSRGSEMYLTMHVPSGLFTAYEGDLTINQRFVSGSTATHLNPRHLMFKGLFLFEDPAMPAAWDVRFDGPEVRA